MERKSILVTLMLLAVVLLAGGKKKHFSNPDVAGSGAVSRV